VASGTDNGEMLGTKEILATHFGDRAQSYLRFSASFPARSFRMAAATSSSQGSFSFLAGSYGGRGNPHVELLQRLPGGATKAESILLCRVDERLCG
jgi:hypothetical protein